MVVDRSKVSDRETVEPKGDSMRGEQGQRHSMRLSMGLHLDIELETFAVIYPCRGCWGTSSS